MTSVLQLLVAFHWADKRGRVPPMLMDTTLLREKQLTETLMTRTRKGLVQAQNMSITPGGL